MQVGAQWHFWYLAFKATPMHVVSALACPHALAHACMPANRHPFKQSGIIIVIIMITSSSSINWGGPVFSPQRSSHRMVQAVARQRRRCPCPRTRQTPAGSHPRREATVWAGCMHSKNRHTHAVQTTKGALAWHQSQACLKRGACTSHSRYAPLTMLPQPSHSLDHASPTSSYLVAVLEGLLCGLQCLQLPASVDTWQAVAGQDLGQVLPLLPRDLQG